MRKNMKSAWGKRQSLGLMLLAFAFSATLAKGQIPPSHINAIYFTNNLGASVVTYVSPFTFQCATGLTCTPGAGNVLVVSAGISEIGGTQGYIPLWGTVPNLINSHLDDSITTAGTITSTEPIASPGFIDTSTVNTYQYRTIGASGLKALVGNAILDTFDTAPPASGLKYKHNMESTEVTINSVELYGPSTGGSTHVSTTSAATLPHDMTFIFDGGGSALAAATAYLTAEDSCTILATDSHALAVTGTNTVTFWDRATGISGEATVSDIISSAGIAVNSAIVHTTASDFSVSTGAAVTALDKVAAHLVVDGTTTWLSMRVQCR